MDSFKKYLAQKGDYIFITSTDIHRLLDGKINPSVSFLNWLKAARHNGASVCAICTVY
jgi:hypothetical protein